MMDVQRQDLKNMLCLLRQEGCREFFEKHILDSGQFPKDLVTTGNIVIRTAKPTRALGWIPSLEDLEGMSLKMLRKVKLQEIKCGANAGDNLTFVFNTRS